MRDLQIYEGIRSWLRELFPALNDSQIQDLGWNASFLNAFLQTHAEEVLLSKNVTATQTFDFFPSRLTILTLICSNPSSMLISLDLDICRVTTLVSKERVVAPAGLLVVSGLVLALPWTILRARRMRGA
jgi:hypothetical protein